MENPLLQFDRIFLQCLILCKETSLFTLLKPIYRVLIVRYFSTLYMRIRYEEGFHRCAQLFRGSSWSILINKANKDCRDIGQSIFNVMEG